MTGDKQNIKGKRRARKLVVQALYQRHISGDELAAIEAQFRAIHVSDNVDLDYFCRIFYGVSKDLARLDQTFEPFLDRKIESINPIELTILRLGTFELIEALEVPYRVVLDEAVTLAKTFGAQDGHRYVNGVLNQVAKQARAVEIDAKLS
ncbi:MAG: transcription antitermination factor NusB [Legionellaceae bacterium]|nr:transcription antitermination factor NusB [Legionellaceae bacterium]